MKNTILILFLCITTNLMAQKDTLYFNSAWNKVENKKEAAYFRPLPIAKINNLYHIRDYYIEGNIASDYFYSDLKNETKEGLEKWYYKNGKIHRITTYKNGFEHGKSTYYTKEGYLRTKGEYKNERPWSGTFPSPCCPHRVTQYETGKEIAYLTFYQGFDQLAKKKYLLTTPSQNSCFLIKKENFLDRLPIRSKKLWMEHLFIFIWIMMKPYP